MSGFVYGYFEFTCVGVVLIVGLFDKCFGLLVDFNELWVVMVVIVSCPVGFVLLCGMLFRLGNSYVVYYFSGEFIFKYY